jgi:hypothetical protein
MDSSGNLTTHVHNMTDIMKVRIYNDVLQMWSLNF